MPDASNRMLDEFLARMTYGALVAGGLAGLVVAGAALLGLAGTGVATAATWYLFTPERASSVGLAGLLLLGPALLVGLVVSVACPLLYLGATRGGVVSTCLHFGTTVAAAIAIMSIVGIPCLCACALWSMPTGTLGRNMEARHALEEEDRQWREDKEREAAARRAAEAAELEEGRTARGQARKRAEEKLAADEAILEALGEAMSTRDPARIQLVAMALGPSPPAGVGDVMARQPLEAVAVAWEAVGTRTRQDALLAFAHRGRGDLVEHALRHGDFDNGWKELALAGALVGPQLQEHLACSGDNIHRPVRRGSSVAVVRVILDAGISASGHDLCNRSWVTRAVLVREWSSAALLIQRGGVLEETLPGGEQLVDVLARTQGPWDKPYQEELEKLRAGQVPPGTPVQDAGTP